MKRVLLLLSLLSAIMVKAQTLKDHFDDANFTFNPVWTPDGANWNVQLNNTYGPDETGANVLRLNINTGGTAVRYISTPNSDWGTAQSWTVWIGRSQPISVSSTSYVWLFANAANITTATVDGYRIRIGDVPTLGVRVILERINDGVATTTIVTSNTALPADVEDFGFRVRVTRNASHQWQIYTGVDLSTIVDGGGESPTSNPYDITLNASPLTLEAAGPPGARVPITGSGFIVLSAIPANLSSPQRLSAAFDLVNFGADNLLPVTFTDFRVVKENDSRARLSWNVAAEHNVDGYEVERSANGVQFSKLGYVKANGSPSYSFTDEKILNGVNFYRVKNIDIDGKFAYTHIVSINGKKGQFIKIFPMPARRDLFIQHHDAISGAQLQITSMEGRIVRVIKVPPNATQTILDLSTIHSGVYFVTYDAGDGNRFTSKFIKQ